MKLSLNLGSALRKRDSFAAMSFAQLTVSLRMTSFGPRDINCAETRLSNAISIVFPSVLHMPARSPTPMDLSARCPGKALSSSYSRVSQVNRPEGVVSPIEQLSELPVECRRHQTRGMTLPIGLTQPDGSESRPAPCAAGTGRL